MATNTGWAERAARAVTPGQRRNVLIAADAGRVVRTETGAIRMRTETRGMGNPPTRCDATVKVLVAEKLLHELTNAGTYTLTDKGRDELERVQEAGK